MAIKNPAAQDLKKTVMYMENLSFDPVYEVLTRIPLTQNAVSGALERQVDIQGNPSMALNYDVDGQLTSIVKTIGATTYTKTFTWTDGQLTGMSAWS